MNIPYERSYTQQLMWGVVLYGDDDGGGGNSDVDLTYNPAIQNKWNKRPNNNRHSMFQNCEQHPPHVCIVFVFVPIRATLCSAVLCRAYGCLFPHCLCTDYTELIPACTHTHAYKHIHTYGAARDNKIQPYTTRESFKQFLLSSRNSNDEDYRPKHFIVSLGISLIVYRWKEITNLRQNYSSSVFLVRQNIILLIFLFFFDSYNLFCLSILRWFEKKSMQKQLKIKIAIFENFNLFVPERSCEHN